MLDLAALEAIMRETNRIDFFINWVVAGWSGLLARPDISFVWKERVDG